MQIGQSPTGHQTHYTVCKPRGCSLRSPPASCAAAVAAAGTSPARKHSFKSNNCPIDLSDRNIAIFWDLDNLAPPSYSLHLTPAIHELKNLLSSWGGTVATVSVYANRVTHARLGSNLLQQLADMDINLVQVEARKQAADVQLTTDAYNFAAAQGQQGCVVCASDDTGFGSILSYISSLGLVTITISTFPSPRYLPNTLPDLSKHPVAKHCHAAVSWRPLELPLAAAHKQQQQQQQVAQIANKSSVSTRQPLLGRGRSWFMLAPSTGSTSSSDAADCLSNTSSAVGSSTCSISFYEGVWINPVRRYK